MIFNKIVFYHPSTLLFMPIKVAIVVKITPVKMVEITAMKINTFLKLALRKKKEFLMFRLNLN